MFQSSRYRSRNLNNWCDGFLFAVLRRTKTIYSDIMSWSFGVHTVPSTLIVSNYSTSHGPVHAFSLCQSPIDGDPWKILSGAESILSCLDPSTHCRSIGRGTRCINVCLLVCSFPSSHTSLYTRQTIIRRITATWLRLSKCVLHTYNFWSPCVPNKKPYPTITWLEFERSSLKHHPLLLRMAALCRSFSGM